MKHCRCDVPALIETCQDTMVCTNCGVEKSVLRLAPVNISYQQRMSVSTHGVNTYSRTKRFTTMLTQSVIGTSFEADDKMLACLYPQRPFATIDDLLVKIKKSRLRDKRYSSLHFFSKHTVTDYKSFPVPPRWEETKRMVVAFFAAFERLYRKHYAGLPFVSYSWLLRTIMNDFELTPFTVFVKPLKCKRRRLRYHNIYNHIKSLMSSDTLSVGVGVGPKSVSCDGGLRGCHNAHLYRSNVL